MRLYSAFDLHSNNSYLGIIDENGKRIFKRKLPNEAAMIKLTLIPFKSEIEGIVVESTYNWYWLVDMLAEDGYRVHLANPTKIQQYSGLKYSNDKHDSFWLAEMLRLGILPEGYIYPKESRPIRDLLRKRSHLVRLRTSLITSLQNIITRNGGSNLKVNDIKALTTDRVQRLLEGNDDLALAGKVSKDSIDSLSRQIKAIEKVIEGRIHLSSEAADHARRYDAEARKFFNRKLKNANATIAHNVLAHKLARAAYYIMRDGVDFMPDKAFA